MLSDATSVHPPWYAPRSPVGAKRATATGTAEEKMISAKLNTIVPMSSAKEGKAFNEKNNRAKHPTAAATPSWRNGPALHARGERHGEHRDDDAVAAEHEADVALAQA